MIVFKPHEVLSLADQYLPENPVIVEAGAFDGRDTRRMAHHWPNGMVHTFEPVPELFIRLERHLAGLHNVRCYQLAVSNSNGQSLFHVAEKPQSPGVACQAGSLRPPKERLHHSRIHFPRTTMVKTVTLDSWAEWHDVPRIDMLWLDVQGHELSVIKAAPRLLKTVSVIHTEVAFSERYEGQEQYDEVKSWLVGYGFKEYGVDFSDTPKRSFGNALFVRGSV